MMTNIQELSEQLAELYGFDSELYLNDHDLHTDKLTPIVADSGRMFELAVEHNFAISQHESMVGVGYWDGEAYGSTWNEIRQLHKDHANKLEATRVAIAKALIKLRSK
jgi:hypothetical protein